jgi:RNA polymerase sigma factor (TIGR02999 family)
MSLEAPRETSQPVESEVDTGAYDRRALDELFDRLYDRIRRLASRVHWSSDNPTLNPTALAHEAYLKLRKDPPQVAAKSYDEVIGVFAHAMQQILIDAARRKKTQKRSMVELPERAELPVEEVVGIAAALEELEREQPRQAQIVRCRFLLGMTTDETAAAICISKRMVEREWQDAKAALVRKINPA